MTLGYSSSNDNNILFIKILSTFSKHHRDKGHLPREGYILRSRDTQIFDEMNSVAD